MYETSRSARQNRTAADGAFATRVPDEQGVDRDVNNHRPINRLLSGQNRDFSFVDTGQRTGQLSSGPSFQNPLFHVLLNLGENRGNVRFREHHLKTGLPIFLTMRRVTEARQPLAAEPVILFRARPATVARLLRPRNQVLGFLTGIFTLPTLGLLNPRHHRKHIRTAACGLTAAARASRQGDASLGRVGRRLRARGAQITRLHDAANDGRVKDGRLSFPALIAEHRGVSRRRRLAICRSAARRRFRRGRAGAARAPRRSGNEPGRRGPEASAGRVRDGRDRFPPGDGESRRSRQRDFG
jgi:hypothetical protein